MEYGPYKKTMDYEENEGYIKPDLWIARWRIEGIEAWSSCPDNIFSFANTFIAAVLICPYPDVRRWGDSYGPSGAERSPSLTTTNRSPDDWLWRQYIVERSYNELGD